MQTEGHLTKITDQHSFKSFKENNQQKTNKNSWTQLIDRDRCSGGGGMGN